MLCNFRSNKIRLTRGHVDARTTCVTGSEFVAIHQRSAPLSPRENLFEEMGGLSKFPATRRTDDENRNALVSLFFVHRPPRLALGCRGSRRCFDPPGVVYPRSSCSNNRVPRAAAPSSERFIRKLPCFSYFFFFSPLSRAASIDIQNGLYKNSYERTI